MVRSDNAGRGKREDKMVSLLSRELLLLHSLNCTSLSPKRGKNWQNTKLATTQSGAVSHEYEHLCKQDSPSCSQQDWGGVTRPQSHEYQSIVGLWGCEVMNMNIYANRTPPAVVNKIGEGLPGHRAMNTRVLWGKHEGT